MEQNLEKNNELDGIEVYKKYYFHIVFKNMKTYSFI